MKQFIYNILSYVKRKQVKKKITQSLAYEDGYLFYKTPVLHTGSDFTLNIATIKEKHISTIYPNNKDIQVIASYDEDEQHYQPISQPKLRNNWFKKLNALYLEKDGYRHDLWKRNIGIINHSQKIPWLSSSHHNSGFLTQLEPIQEDVPTEYEHLIPYFNIIEITRIEIIEKELLLESVRSFRFVKDLRVPILTETDRFIKIYYKYVDIEEAQERYDEKQCQLELETTFDNLIEGKK